jgi:glycosyltransferase involved in cell wall biosynthesis
VSELKFDARVWKEARSLAARGTSVRLLGLVYGSQEKQYREDGVDVMELPFPARSSSASNVARVAAVLHLWVAILRTPAAAYHAHNIHTALPAWLASRLRRSSLVYDAHELYGEPMGHGVYGRILRRGSLTAERFSFRRSDAVITTNESRAEVLRRRHGSQKVTVLANVPPRVETLEACDPGFPSGAPVLLYQGGIYSRGRAFLETIQSLRLLPDVHFVVVGFGREFDLELLGRWAQDEGVASRVHVLPPRPFRELVSTAAAATVGIVPIKPINLGSYLGDTNKLFEYLMAGLPVVASDLPEIRRVVVTGHPCVGELFDPNSPQSIAQAVEAVISDVHRYEARRKEARRLALEQYNWEIEEKRLFSLYDDLGLTHLGEGRLTQPHRDARQ